MVNQWRVATVGCAMFLTLAGQTEAARQPSIAVIAYNQAGVAGDILARTKIEISRIYAEAGIAVIWMGPTGGEPSGTFVIRLMIRPRAVGTLESVMGTALGDAHEMGGSAFVFYDRVLASAHARQQNVAGVLAYAMAHEMGHLLLPGPAHASSGIMRPSWDGDDLRHIANGSMRFTPVQQIAIRARIERHQQQ